MTDTAKTQCTVRDGRFVEPCDTLSAMIDNYTPGFSNTKGVCQWSYTSLTTREPSRSFIGAKTKAHPKGMAFNFCPMCGEKIDAPFASDDAEAA